MVRARLTSKGQVTIPVGIRRRYDLQTGDEIQFIAEERGTYLVPLKRKNLMDLYGLVKTDRPWPGIGKARQIAGTKRGEELRRKAPRS